MATAAIVCPNPRDLILMRGDWAPDALDSVLRTFNPRSDLGLLVKRAARYLPLDEAMELIDKMASVVVMESSLFGVLHRDGVNHDLGLLSRKVVTTTGVTYLCTYLSGAVSGANLKFHGLGTGTGAEASGDTALGTELTTEYATDNTRPTGTSVASTNTFTSAATNTIDSGTPAVTEHGLFSASSAGTLWDRSKFSAINMVAADGLTTTYVATFAAGG